MKADISRIKSMEKDVFSGLMEGNILEIGKKENSMELELIYQVMDKVKKENESKEKEFVG